LTVVEGTREGRVGWITFRRPEKLNALNPEAFEEFSAELARMTEDDEVRCIIIRGEGRAFSVGFDVDTESADLKDAPRRTALADWEHLRQNLERWLDVWRCPKPVIAAVHGYCMGLATQLAVCCDLTVVADDAVIGWPSLPLGGGLLSPVTCWLVGPKKAKELSYIAGSRMTGEEAAALGWANYATDTDNVVPLSRSLAQKIARTPPDLLRVKKRAINRLMDTMGFSETIMAGAEFDAIAHDSPGMVEITAKVRELGLKGAIAWFESQEDG
jgi:enoyl-CoA hydratase